MVEGQGHQNAKTIFVVALSHIVQFTSRHTSSNSVTRNYCCRAREVTLSFMNMLIALTYLAQCFNSKCGSACCTSHWRCSCGDYRELCNCWLS